MFGSFGYYKNWADKKFQRAPPTANLALASCLTGTTEAILTPLERVQMLLQDRKYHREYRNTIDALLKLKKFGWREYYRGYTCVLMRNGPSNILFFGLRDEIKKLLPRLSDKKGEGSTLLGTPSAVKLILNSSQQQQHMYYNKSSQYQSRLQERPKDSLFHNFLSGAILGMFISTLFYPLSVVRTRMQTRAPGTEFLSIYQAAVAVYVERDRKFARLFHGCLINVLRQFVSWGIINCSYEYLLDLLHDIK